jgi:IS5 family transposase
VFFSGLYEIRKTACQPRVRRFLEYLIRDRLSFVRFLDLGLEDPAPDATTVWLFREALAKAGLVAQLFVLFNQHLEAKGYIARGGQIVDATIVSAPVQHNSRRKNEAIKAGKTPEGWQEKPANRWDGGVPSGCSSPSLSRSWGLHPSR